MKRITGRIAYKVFKPLWSRLDGSKARVRVIVRHGGKVLLVKNWIGSGRWTLPGGGIGAHETPEECAAREIKEELGIDIGAGLYKHVARMDDAELAGNIVELYLIDVTSEHFRRSKKELTDAAWYPINKLPEGHNDIVSRAIALIK